MFKTLIRSETYRTIWVCTACEGQCTLRTFCLTFLPEDQAQAFLFHRACIEETQVKRRFFGARRVVKLVGIDAVRRLFEALEDHDDLRPTRARQVSTKTQVGGNGHVGDDGRQAATLLRRVR